MIKPFLKMFRTLPLVSGIIIITGLHAPISKADDTDVYITAGAGANVLFIFDESGSMDWNIPNGTQKRYDVMVDAIRNVLDTLKEKENLKIGLSMFGYNSQSTGILWPITGIGEDANDVDSAINVGAYKTYEIIPKILEDRGPNGGTPIVTALYEAALYFMGENVSYGNGGRQPETWVGDKYTGGDMLAARPASYSPTNAWNGSWFDSNAKYQSPITDNCAKNYIVLLTDGEANSPNTSVINSIESYLGTSCSGSDDGQKCGPELVEFLANTDLQAANGVVPSKVITHTIGFAAGSGNDFMEELAAAGGGISYDADDATDLEEVFETILTAIASETQTFTGLSTSINSETLSSDNRVFINMFKPDTYRSWVGNTKGYFFGNDGLIDINGNDAVEVVNDDVQFVNTSQSFWSAAADGNNIQQGGASSKLNAANRKIYTYTGTGAPSNSSLDLINKTDNTFTKEMFDVASNTEKDNLIDWLYDAKMGDPMHANVKLLKYANKQILYTMTNQGLLHAIDVTSPTVQGDTTGGQELAAYIPQSLLPNLKNHKALQTGADHLYGLDGTMAHWHQDSDGDGVINNSEKAFLYFGMRRGGNQYFALDISSSTGVPTLMWRIDGGAGDFAKLGQSWSKPTLTTVKWQGNEKKVLLFTGGYDVAQDGKTVRSDDTIGNAIFMVDATTGTLLWSASNSGSAGASFLPLSDMVYSIPSDLTVIDAYGDDDLADRLYVGDMGGQIWRIDFTDSFGSLGGAVGYKLADLADDSTTGFRRFYMPPSVSLVNDAGNLYYAIAIGSGARANPMDQTVNDRYYMLKDENLNHGTTQSTLSSASLYNATANLIGEGSSSQQASAKTDLDAKSGWYIELEGSGEKAISPSLIWNNIIAFTTYTPVNNTGNACNSSAGLGRLYLVKTGNATPALDNTDDNNYTKADRNRALPGVGIPTAPVPYFPAGESRVDLYIGHEKALELDNPVVKINWKVVQ